MAIIVVGPKIYVSEPVAPDKFVSCHLRSRSIGCVQ